LSVANLGDKLKHVGHLRRRDALHYVLPSQGHDLTDTKLARPDHRPVCAGVILVHANNSLHHFRISLGCVWVKINRLGMSDMLQSLLQNSLMEKAN
jgi:hypothetical protein